MLYGTSSFRKSAFALTTIAALAAFASFPVAAQQVASSANGYNGSAACAQFKGTDQSIKCEINESAKRTQAAQQRGINADARAEVARSSTVCMEDVGNQIQAAKKVGPLSPEQKAMFKAQIERCDKT